MWLMPCGSQWSIDDKTTCLHLALFCAVFFLQLSAGLSPYLHSTCPVVTGCWRLNYSVHGTEAPCEVFVKELHVEIILFTYLHILCFCDLVVSACLPILHHFFSMSVDASCMFFIVTHPLLLRPCGVCLFGNSSSLLLNVLLILYFCGLVVSACLAILHHFFSMSVDASCMFFIVAGALWTAGQVFFAMVC